MEFVSPSDADLCLPAVMAEKGQLANGICADPFKLTDPGAVQFAKSAEAPCAYDGRREFPPDPEMWAALREGEMLSEILTDFYTRVFDDPVLSPYFKGVTKQRLIEKVYSFMRQIFTGEKLYFGDRPRNAHHWMVISDDIFDYREDLMISCIRRRGLEEHLIKRWRSIEENFRSDIVKNKPYPRIMEGLELPLEGFGYIKLLVGSLCDGCNREIDPGEQVQYHLRLGQTYCCDCQQE